VTDSDQALPTVGPDGGMTLRFWGARGSLPAPGPSTARYGGNTVCVELRCGPHLLILDAGSGLREFGAALAEDDVSVDADILLSHTHLDHICGLPFFAAMHDPKARIRFWGGHLAPPAGIAEALLTSWRAPLMPDMDAEFRAEIAFHDFIAGQFLQLRPDLCVGTTTLRHPGNAVGYRVEWAGTSVCYITDNELYLPSDKRHNPRYLEQLTGFVRGADVLITDTTYRDSEYPSKVDWGHSCVSQVAKLAARAEVKRLHLFHHDIDQTDEAIDIKLREAREALQKMESKVECSAPAENSTLVL